MTREELTGAKGQIASTVAKLEKTVVTLQAKEPAGRTAPGWVGQRPLLEAEGVGFSANGRVDMKQYRWEC